MFHHSRNQILLQHRILAYQVRQEQKIIYQARLKHQTFLYLASPSNTSNVSLVSENKEPVSAPPNSSQASSASLFSQTSPSNTSNVSSISQNIKKPVEPPEEFLCPVSLEIMTDPVVLPSGNSIDRSSILNMIANGQKFDPLTREPITEKDLRDNRNLKTRIEKWCKKHNYGLENKVNDNTENKSKP